MPFSLSLLSSLYSFVTQHEEAFEDLLSQLKALAAAPDPVDTPQGIQERGKIVLQILADGADLADLAIPADVTSTANAVLNDPALLAVFASLLGRLASGEQVSLHTGDERLRAERAGIDWQKVLSLAAVVAQIIQALAGAFPTPVPAPAAAPLLAAGSLLAAGPLLVAGELLATGGWPLPVACALAGEWVRVSGRRLGKLPPRHDERTLLLAKYLRAALPAAPASMSWDGKVTSAGGWPMMLNDTLGDCAIAAPGHQIQCWTANAGAEATVSDADILAAYSAVSGYDPATGEGDDGCNELDVLKYWRGTGIGGHKIGAFCSVEPTNHDQIRDAIWLLGGIYIGLALPLSAQNQSVWAAPVNPILARFFPQFQPGSWGGHAVYVLDYDQRGLTCITWGSLQRMTWAFLDAYCEEAWGIVSQDWIDGTGNAPSGFDLATLTADLALL